MLQGLYQIKTTPCMLNVTYLSSVRTFTTEKIFRSQRPFGIEFLYNAKTLVIIDNNNDRQCLYDRSCATRLMLKANFSDFYATLKLGRNCPVTT